MRSFIIGRVIGCSLLSFALVIDHAHAQASIAVQWSTQGLSVQAHRASAALVLSEVSRQTGIRIRGLDKVTGTLDVDFAPTPLRGALRRLLEDFNYVIAGTESATTIRIHSRIARANGDPAATIDNDDPTTETPAIEPASDQADPEQQAQFDAAERLAGATAASLLAAVHAGPAATRITALRALADRDPAAAAELAGAAIDDPDPAVSGAALQTLSQIDHPDALKALGARLQHPNVAVRRALLELLFVRNDPDSLAAVQSLLDDPDGTIRARATELVKTFERSLKGKSLTPNRR
jgi:hypothetical protein